jgi:hypothetical protein
LEIGSFTIHEDQGVSQNPLTLPGSAKGAFGCVEIGKGKQWRFGSWCALDIGRKLPGN